MPERKPNIILINCDDLGYGDLGCYGSACNRTPAIDRMAAEGLRLTDFYMASPVCSPSRGGMLTGCYPNRIGFDEFDGIAVLFPGQSKGLHPDEKTFAALLKEQGYVTALVGKWHCGDQPPFLPTRHGFDHYFGLPYSNDMGRQRSTAPRQWIPRCEAAIGADYHIDRDDPQSWFYPPLPLMRDDTVVQQQPDLAALTERYVGECVEFMRAHRDRPFLLYFAQMHVHLPIYCPDAFLQRSQNGRYGAAVEQIDWSVSVLLHELQQLGIDENTLVIFTSDNGSRARGEGGSNAPLRGTKATCWEGGQRVPCILRWPGTIRAGSTCCDLATAMDFLPTFARIAGAPLPADRTLDGHDLSPCFSTSTRGDSGYDHFAYFHVGNLHAIRKGAWKLHLFRDADGEICELYDLASDPGESTDLAARHPEIVRELTALAQQRRNELGDRRLGIPGTDRRPQGVHHPNTPLTRYDPNHPYFASEYDLTEAG